MTPLEVPPLVLALAAESGADVRPTPDGSGLDLGDSETSHVVRWVDDAYQVDEVQRGTVTRPVLRTAEEPAVVRFLALVLASRWRSVAGMPPLPPVEPGLPDGAVVEKAGPRRFTLWWVEDGVRRRADDLVEFRAVDLARALAHPLDVVVAALRAPDGEPVFGPRG